MELLAYRVGAPSAGVMRRYERASTLLTSNRPVEDWGKLLGDSVAANAGRVAGGRRRMRLSTNITTPGWLVILPP